VSDNNKKLFFLGKGGTGKTTLSALTSFSLSIKNKVVLISLDPAHNLFDIFDISTSKSYTKIRSNLILEEINIDFWIKKYLDSIEKQVSRSYHYLTSLGLEKHLEIIKYSPGMEEYALLYAYQSLIKKYDGYDYLVFDMPPTALALRFFNLPRLSLIWLDKLIQIRKSILKKKKIIETVKKGDSETSKDRILDKLLRLKEENTIIDAYFKKEGQTNIFVVLNDDELSIAESKDIQDKLLSQEVIIKGFILNKVDKGIKHNDLEKQGLGLLSVLPAFSQPLLGIEMFNTYCRRPEFIRYFEKIDR
jgi:arsenite-transporting ATPase